MMRTFLNYLLSLALLMPTFAPIAVHAQTKGKTKTSTSKVYDPSVSCPKGECVEKMVGLLEAKIKAAYKDKCLPPSNTKDPEAWFENNKMSMNCFKQLREIEELQDKLQKVENYLSLNADKGTCPHCKQADNPADGIMGNLAAVQAANEELSCSPERKKQIWDKCGSDAMCVLIASSLTTLGPLANKVLPASLKNKGCNSNDSCLTQLAMGFVKAVFGLFEGLWDLLKGAGNLIKKGASNLWDWVRGAEDKSSTAQLAAAKASEDEGIFRQLMNDFGGTMSRIWSGFLAAIKEWLSAGIFCQEWSGVPQFSTCKRPAQGLDCTECKAMITGMCALTGVIVAEVIPAFLTGGVVTCAKYGASGAAKVAKLFKVSATTMKAIKSSKVASMAVKTASAVTKVVKASKVINTVSHVMKTALSLIKTVMLKPIVKGTRVSLQAMRKVAAASKVYVMSSAAGPVVIFGTKVVKTAGKVVIFPFENAMTRKAFQLGEKTTATVIAKATGKVMNLSRPVLASTEAARGLAAIDDAYTSYRAAKLGSDAKAVQKAEAVYIKAAREHRGKILESYIKEHKKVKFSDLVDEFYPELKYGKYAKHVTPDEVTKAERELFEAISKVSDPKKKEALTLAYQDHLTSGLRKVEMPAKSFTRDEVLEHAALNPNQKADLAIEITDKNVSAAQKQKIVTALKETEEAGGTGVLKASNEQLTKQNKILTDAGFTKKEADEIVQSGLASRVSPEDTYTALRRVPVPKAEEIAETVSNNESFMKLIVSLPPERRPAAARALKIFEDAGMPSDEVIKTFSQYEKNFNHVQKLAGTDSDAASLLAEYIKRERKAGVADDIIKQKLDKAFGACK